VYKSVCVIRPWDGVWECVGIWVGLCVWGGMTLHVCLGEQMDMLDSDPCVGVFL
jgi:hypothetical protein